MYKTYGIYNHTDTKFLFSVTKTIIDFLLPLSYYASPYFYIAYFVDRH